MRNLFRRSTIATPLQFALLVAASSLTGCAGNGEALDVNGRPSTPGSAGTALTPDFNSIQDNVFTPVCTRCHAGATAPRGLRLDAGNSYALLVGVASGQVPAIQRVQAGNPTASYLIQKLQGTAAVGQRMPLGGPFLPQSTIDVIATWIRNGAPRPTSFVALQKPTFASDAGLQVVTTSPLDGASTTEPVTQIVVGFDRELDASLVYEGTVSLVDSTGRPVDARLTVPLANSSTLLITPQSPLPPGTYRVELRGSGGGALAGLDARVLNANVGSVSGSDSTITFSVSAAAKEQP